MGSSENAEQLIIALEPEAAAIFCQEKNMNDFQAETGSRSVDGILSQLNTHYIVVDIGGKLYFCKLFSYFWTFRLSFHRFVSEQKITSHKEDGSPQFTLKIYAFEVVKSESTGYSPASPLWS